jgi:hypothetical protein
MQQKPAEEICKGISGPAIQGGGDDSDSPKP